jgi:phosphoribosylformimino-5-aminoimidazole carboxamide ribotide isomerase
VQILPAIDLQGGQCVRLRQGDYQKQMVFGSDPAGMAARWVGRGATGLHIVDLDGARQGQPVNGQSIRKIVESVQVPCQLGGGIREEKHLEEALSWGVQRVVLGTKALADPPWLERMAKRYPTRVIVGIDARDGKVATEGWLKVSQHPALDLARQCAAWPLAALIYTDISRDGMLTGPNLDAFRELAGAVALPIIASGGVTTLEDVGRLAKLRLSGCIIGRALYEGLIDLAQAIAVARDAAESQRQTTP